MNHSRPKMRARPLGAAAVGLALLVASPPAPAQSSLDQKYPEGFALSAFEPAPAGDRFFAVADASSFRDERLRLALTGDYPTGPVLSRTDNVTGEKADVVRSQLYLHAGAAYPITDFLHAHANVPFAAFQKGDSAASPKGGKLGDIRLGLRANVMSPSSEAFAFGPGVDLWLPTGSEDNLTGDGKVRVNPRLGVSGRAGAFVYAANVGYLVRKKVNVGSLETGDAVTFGAGAGVVLFNDVLQVGPELWGNRQVAAKGNGTKVMPVSALFGAKVHIGDFALGAAYGPGLTDAPGVAPRVVVSLALAPQTQVEVESHVSADLGDRDHDGVSDTDDACPDRAGVASPESAKNGCPAADEPIKALAAADGDGDGVPDAEDACPDKLGEKSDDPKLNGCPAPRIADADGDGVRDELDACPDVKGDPSTDKLKNGCPPPLADRDGDGVLDKDDACPDVKGDPSTDKLKNGCPPPPTSDLDGDGVPDKDDACPRDAGEPTKNRKTTGCPKPAPAVAKVKANAVKPATEAGDVADVTFAGFHVFEDGTSRLYVQLSASVTVDANVVGKKAEYLLHDARIPIRNNKNPLLTQNFVAQVVSARLVPVGKETRGRRKGGVRGHAAKPSDVRLLVVMREDAKPQYRMVRNADGTATLVVDFPKPVKPPTPPADPAAPKPKENATE